MVQFANYYYYKINKWEKFPYVHDYDRRPVVQLLQRRSPDYGHGPQEDGLPGAVAVLSEPWRGQHELALGHPGPESVLVGLVVEGGGGLGDGGGEGLFGAGAGGVTVDLQFN